jgi:predicted nucleic acid-binding protein
MIALDTNILVYAHRRDMPQHTLALRAMQRLVAEDRTWAVPWPCIHEFLAAVSPSFGQPIVTSAIFPS